MRDTETGTAEPHAEKIDPTTIHDCGQVVELVTNTEYNWISGWRLHLISLGAALCMFLINIEVTIIGTSLVTIVNDLEDFTKQGWVITSYLLTYTSLLIIWTKASDIFGRKVAILTAVGLFTAFSGACGAAQTLNQLILFRALQGIGAAGSVSMALVICYELVPKDRYPAITTQVAGSTALGALVGPLIGGGLSKNSTWRWVFLFNVPAGAVTFVIILVALPANFPYQGNANYIAPTWRQKLSRTYVTRLDISGAFFLLGASFLFVTVLLEAGTEFAWKSTAAIVCLVISGIMWILFVFNEWVLTNDKYKQEPIFPSRFLLNRPWMGVLLISLLSGLPYNIITIDIPQRFQTVYGVSPVDAGVRLLPFNVFIAFFGAATPTLAQKTQIPPIWFLLLGSILQLVGISLFSSLPSTVSASVPTANYGYETLTACGIGMCFGMSLVLPPHLVEKRDTAIAGGALLQFRVLGGAIGLAIGSSILNNYLTNHLQNILTPAQFSSLQQSTAEIATFPLEVQDRVASTFLRGYNLQMQVLIGFSALQVLLVSMLWKKKQISIGAQNKE